MINFLSIKNFFWNFLWWQKFSEKNFIESEKIFEKTWNKIWYLNWVNSLFEQKKYSEALEKLEKISFDKKETENFSANFLAWNIFYKLWEEKNIQSEKEEIKNFWTKSLSYYETALDIKFDEKVRENYEFVKNKIEDLKTEEEKKQDEKEKQEEQEKQKKEDKKAEEEKKKAEEKEKQKQENWENKNWENWKNKEWEWEDWEKKEGWEKWEKSENKEWKKDELWKKEGDKSDEISKEEQEALDEYQKKLEQAQKSFSEWFNKVYDEWSNDPFENFFGNWLGWWDKKDW